MKKFTLLLLVAMILPMAMNAQEKSYVQMNRVAKIAKQAVSTPTAIQPIKTVQFVATGAKDVPEGYASVTLTADDVWGDGSGYQMLLDEDATAYGSIFPATGALTSSGDADESVYAEFEYTIPEGADGACSTTNMVCGASVTILIPAGVYDWCITNPTPGDRVWIASSNGSIGGRADDFEFLSGVGYEFVVTFGGQNDQTDLIVDDPTAPVIPTNVTVTPTATTGAVAWVEGENNDTWNLRWRPWTDPALQNRFWDLPYDGYEDQIEGWQLYDADGDGNGWQLYYTDDDQTDLCFSSASYDGGALSPDNWLFTPEVPLGGTLKFDTWNYSSYYADKIMVYVGPADWETVDDFDAVSDFITPGTTAENIEIDLSAYSDMGVIAFRHYDCNDLWRIFIDNIAVEIPGAVEPYAWTLEENVENPYTIENLDPETQYEVQVQGVAEDGRTTDWTAIVNFTTLAEGAGFTKHINAYTATSGWYLISSPVGDINPDQVINMLDGEYDLYRFSQQGDSDGKEWLNYETGTFTLLHFQGYLYANAADVDLFFPGEAYDGTGSVYMSYYEGHPLTGVNVMGNPWAEAATVDRAFYTLNPDNNTYVSHAAGDEVPAMEGVIVIAEGEDETVTFTKGGGGKSANATLSLTQNGNVIDRAIMTFEGRNLPKMQFNPDHSKVYMPVNGKDYAVAAVESFGEMPVNFKAENNGSYTFNLGVENVEFSYLHLIDNMTGADIDLLANPSYSFDAKTRDYASRFRLVFATGNANESSNFAFVSNGNIIVNGEGTLQVIDVMGRVISTSQVSGMSSVNVNAAGVYVLQLTNGNETKIQKIVVR